MPYLMFIPGSPIYLFLTEDEIRENDVPEGRQTTARLMMMASNYKILAESTSPPLPPLDLIHSSMRGLLQLLLQRVQTMLESI